MTDKHRPRPFYQCVNRYFNAQIRRRITPYYFIILLILMWAPLNGLGVPLNNYLFGIRFDHVLHATVYIPCSWFIVSRRHRCNAENWLLSVLVGLTTESVQFLLPYRSGDINDMIANFFGATLGFLIVLGYRCYVRRGPAATAE